MIDRLSLVCSLKLNAMRLARFLQSIEAGYHPANPYHNAIHAADVVQVSKRTCIACSTLIRHA